MGYFLFAKNLILNLSYTLENHPVHFYCLDKEIYNALKNLSIPNKKFSITYECIDMNVSKSFENYNSDNYNKITHTKMTILQHALDKYPFIHFIDCDVVCIKEPSLEHYNKYKDYDIVFQSDSGFNNVEEYYTSPHGIWACTGNMTLRNTPSTLTLLKTIIRYQILYPNKNDQECLQRHFIDSNINDITKYTNAKLFTYDIKEYTNGHWINTNLGYLHKTYFFHANYTTGETSKINLLKSVGMWIAT